MMPKENSSPKLAHIYPICEKKLRKLISTDLGGYGYILWQMVQKLGAVAASLDFL